MIRKCPACGVSNRVPAARLMSEGRCGKCKAPLPRIAEPLDVGTQDFRDIVAEARVPILVDFWAPWCGPCRTAAPYVAHVAKEMSGRALVLKVNVDENQELAREYDISSIPSFAVFKDKKLLMREAGLVNHAQLRKWLESAERA